MLNPTKEKWSEAMSIARMLMLASVVALTQPVWTFGAGGDANAATVGYRYTGGQFTTIEDWPSLQDHRITGELFLEFEGAAASAPWRNTLVLLDNVAEAIFDFGFPNYYTGYWLSGWGGNLGQFEVWTDAAGAIDYWHLYFDIRTHIDEGASIYTSSEGRDGVGWYLVHPLGSAVAPPQTRSALGPAGTWRVISLDGEAIDELPPPVVIPAPPAALLFVSALLGLGFFGARSRTK